jgi:hypothetical protein
MTSFWLRVTSFTFWKSIFLDLLFLISIFLITISAKSFEKSNPNLSIYVTGVSLFLVLISYSIFKYRIWRIITNQSKRRLPQFFVLNFIFFASYLLVILVTYIILNVTIKTEYLKIYFFIFLLIISLFCYILLNVMQILVFTNEKLIYFIRTLTKIRIYVILAIQFLILLLYLVIYYIIDPISSFMPPFTILTLILFNAYNRTFFINNKILSNHI